MGRTENIAIFEDTQKLYRTNAKLKEAVERSLVNQKLILEKDNVPSHINARPHERAARVIVSRKRSYEAAAEHYDAGLKVCVHNFASAANPGGGVIKGAGAQEECLCRCSTLYPNLDSAVMWEGFYRPHRRQSNPLHNDDCIFTPSIVVFKTDTYLPKLMEEKNWYTVDVITCAAPNLRENPSNAYNPSDGENSASINRDALQALHEKRLRRILDIACENGEQAIVLGAFGCGAFENPPAVVAAATRTVVKEYLYCFDVIEFAVYCRPQHEENYEEFVKKLSIIR